MRRTFALCLLAASLPLAACDVTGSDSRRILLDQLAGREAFWAENGAASYSLEMTRECACEDESKIWQVQLEIVDGEIVAGEHVFTGNPLTQAEIAQQYDVEDLFDIARDALNRGVASINISYDQDYGFIDVLRIDYDARTSTDDVFISVDSYVPAGSGTT